MSEPSERIVDTPRIEQIDAMYRGEFQLPDGSVMPPPWEIVRPQPAVVELTESGRLTGRVLDAGCGTGRHSAYLAEEGHGVTEVVGFDGSPTAIGLARERVQLPNVSFVVADATEMDGVDGPFDSVLDLGLFHMLDATGQVAYARALARVVRPGGTAYVVAFAHSVTPEVLRAAFGEGWQVPDPEPTFLYGKIPPGETPPGLDAVVDEETGLSKIRALVAAVTRA
jgi:SAM-dependent methyltransferase